MTSKILNLIIIKKKFFIGANMKYPFNVPPVLGNEVDYIKDAIASHKICGDGAYTKKCNAYLEEMSGCNKALLTTSGTSALEIAAMLSNVKSGDEVIMPSFTFVSTANAFVLRGAKCVFVDVRPDTMNIDENLIEQAITPHTKAIAPVHYAGVVCEMDKIMDIAKKHNLIVIEDAAQAVTSTYKGKAAGAIADIGCYSFHETKNFSMGEGGAVLMSTEELSERAEVLREKGTNRSRFFRGFVDKYTWVDIGSSYLPSELNAAYLYPQLLDNKKITDARMAAWNRYRECLQKFADNGRIEFQHIPDHCKHNAHMFYIKLKDIDDRQGCIDYLKQYDINSVFHYIPLHSSPAGLNFGYFAGEDKYTTRESERLLRLPLYYGLSADDAEYISSKVIEYLEKH